MVDRVMAVLFRRLKNMFEGMGFICRNEFVVCLPRKRLQSLWRLAMSCSLIVLLVFSFQQWVQAEDIPGVIPAPKFSENVLKEIIKEDSTGINITGLTIGTQFMNVTTRVNSTRNSEEGRRTRGISGEMVSDDLYAGLLSDAGFGYSSSSDETSFFSNIGVFVQGANFFGDKELTQEPAFDFDNKDVGIGVDYKLTGSLILGTLFNYTNSDVDFHSSGEGTKISARNISVYGTYNVTNNIYVDGYGMYGWSDYGATRNMSLVTTELDEHGIISSTQTDNMLRIDNTGDQCVMGVSSGYDYNVGAFSIEPLGRLFYAKTTIEDFEKTMNISDVETETLAVGAQKTESLTTALGMDVSYAYKTNERLQKVRLGVIIPQVRAEWVHEFMNDSRNVEASFVQANQIISASTAAPDRDYFKVGVGLSALFAGGISAYIQYEETLGLSNITARNIAVGLRVEL